MTEEALPFDLKTEENIPTEPKIPVVPHVIQGDFKQALLNVASIAGGCFSEMYIDALENGHYELARLVVEAEGACNLIKRYIIKHQ